jgi:DNA-binding transcriptional LysR family regulator
MHTDDLDFTQIRLVAELLRLRSVSAASQSIGLSQSAASHALAKLRDQLGDPLFTRTGKGVEPTPYGERVGLAARESLDVLRAGLASNRPFDPATTTRRFNIYTSDIGQMDFLPRLSAFLATEAPGATVRVLTIPLDNPGAALSSGEVDLAVGFFDNLISGFLQSSVFPEHYVCIVRAAHPKFRTGMSLDAFLGAKHAIADSTGMAHAIIDRVLARHRIHRKDAVRVPGFHVLPMIVANSDLLAVVPNRLAQAFARFEAIKILPVPVPTPSIDIKIYWHERYHHDPPNQWFRSISIKLLRQPKSRAARNGRSRSKS